MECQNTQKTMEKWTDEEVQVLLRIYSEDEIQKEFETSTRSEMVYQKISLRLAELGINHTAKKCREKIKKLKQDYKRNKVHNNRSGSYRRFSRPKWFDSLDAILGQRPAYSGAVSTRDTATVLFEAMTDDTRTSSLDDCMSSAEDDHPSGRLLLTEPRSVDSPVASSSQCPVSPPQGPKWSDEDVQALLRIYSEDEIQREFESSTRNEKVYQKISLRLAELGMQHTAKQCREKIKKMKQDYKKIKDHINQCGPYKRTSRPRWYDSMDAILGHRSANSVAVGTIDSATVALEGMTDDIKTEGLDDLILSTEDDQPSDPTLPMEPMEPSFSDSSAVSSSPCSVSPPEARKRHRGKRKRDSDFLETMREMEKSTMEILRQGHEQRERYFQLLLEHDAQEAAAREREFALRREEAAEARRQQDAFQQGFLAILDRLVQVLDKRNGPTLPPLD